ncbi:hypothetical protein ASO20_01990 [Mycoplasma sp. (ex Biomphalaria glabrata)]|nr:hypothetical protein ASO20_01990 [Mycoplasma sp. (ex Biomphalaria glabrata)]
MLNRYLVTCSFDGRLYSGWNVQVSTPTIQATIQNAFKKIFKQEIKIYSSGRTDAGVHAEKMYFHFDFANDFDLNKILMWLNRLLPLDIRVIKIRKVSLNFHARFSAKWKIYRYKFKYNTHQFNNQYYLLINKNEIDFSRLEEILNVFIGEHDFYNFSTKSIIKNNTIRLIKYIKIKKMKMGFEIEICGNGFLHNMVRKIIAFAIDNMNNTNWRDEITKFLDKKNNVYPKKVPGYALYLKNVIY